MTTSSQLHEAYIKGMMTLTALKGILSQELLTTQANAWAVIRQMADRAHYAEWEATNPEAAQALATAIVDYKAAYAEYTEEQWEDDLYYDDYYVKYPRPQQFGYKEIEWPDFRF